MRPINGFSFEAARTTPSTGRAQKSATVFFKQVRFGTRLAVMFSVTVLLVCFMRVCRQVGPNSGPFFRIGVFMLADVAVRVHLALAAVRRL